MTRWRDFAHCRGMDPNIFYPGSADPKTEAVAVAICNLCTVRVECLDEAIESNDLLDDYGIRGGVSQRGRALLKRERRKVSA